MQWPFVTRATLNEAVRERNARIEKLEAQKEELDRKLFHIHNQLTYRATGIVTHPELMPKIGIVPQPEETKKSSEPPEVLTQVQRAARSVGGRARSAIIAISDNNLKEAAQKEKIAAQIAQVAETPAQSPVAEAAEIFAVDVQAGRDAAQG